MQPIGCVVIFGHFERRILKPDMKSDQKMLAYPRAARSGCCATLSAQIVSRRNFRRARSGRARVGSAGPAASQYAAEANVSMAGWLAADGRSSTWRRIV